MQLGWRIGLGLVILVVVAACSGQSDRVLRRTTASTLDPVDERPVAPIEWEACFSGLECASIEVPLDYRIVDGETISIRISRDRAANPDERIGVLFTNPGGPGRSGTAAGFTAPLSDRFDVIGFDPRGVGESEPAFACGEDGESLEHLLTVDGLIDEPAEDEAVAAAVQLCVDSMGDAAGLIHTDYVARDMDQIRRALGEEQISYLGFSYGAALGGWYASLFPDNVRAMVVDAGGNPINDPSDFEALRELSRDWLRPTEEALEQALSSCINPQCAIYNDGDPESVYFEAIDKLPLVVEATGGHPDAGYFGLVSYFYAPSNFQDLWDALAALAEDDNPMPLSQSALFQFEKGPGAVNVTGHINCLDDWALNPEFDRVARLELADRFFAAEAELNEEFPLIGRASHDSLVSRCSHMDVLGTPALDVPFDGGGVPILVVGNRLDVVVPFKDSEELAEETLAGGRLVEVSDPGHIAYPGKPCVDEAVHAALIDLDYPDERLVC